jgi:hypothetical protein
MATSTQNQPYSAGGNPYPAPSQQQQQGPPQSAYGSSPLPPQSAGGHYTPSLPSAPPSYQFDKYCIIHIATTCDEHGVYVTKDSAEVIEIGWVVVDARDPNLPEVCILSMALSINQKALHLIDMYIGYQR